MDKLKTLSRFNFNIQDKRYIKGFYHYLKDPQINGPLFIYKPSSKIKLIISEIKQAVFLFGEDLGYNLKLRIPDSDTIRFVKRANLNTKYKSRVLKEDIRGIFDPKTFLIYISIDNQNKLFRENFSLAHSINHELIHFISHKKIHIDKNDNSFRIVESGLRKINKYFFLDEAVTELTNLVIINKYWGRFPNLKMIQKNALSEISYVETLKTKKTLEQIAEKQGTSFEHILGIVQHDYLTGSRNIFTKLPKTSLITIR
jgi:hypothetical protein